MSYSVDLVILSLRTRQKVSKFRVNPYGIHSKRYKEGLQDVMGAMHARLQVAMRRKYSGFSVPNNRMIVVS